MKKNVLNVLLVEYNLSFISVAISIETDIRVVLIFYINAILHDLDIDESPAGIQKVKYKNNTLFYAL